MATGQIRYNVPSMAERLQKILARAGLGSRRECEEMIISGRVRVNGSVAKIGQKADPATDSITVDGVKIESTERLIYIALHKPRFVLSTVKSESGDPRKTVRDLVPISDRVYPVGRLDFESEGLVLMTNDGDLTQKLTHPSFGHTKVYRVLLAKRPDEDQLATWRRGAVLSDGYKTQPVEIHLEASAGKGAWVRVRMREGRKRQIRETASQLGLPVVKILRISIGPLQLGNLKSGQWRYLTRQEVEALKSPENERHRSKPHRKGRGGFVHRTPKPRG